MNSRTEIYQAKHELLYHKKKVEFYEEVLKLMKEMQNGDGKI